MLGSDLLVCVGKPEDVLPGLNPSQVLAQAEVCSEELSVEKKVKNQLGSKAPLTLIWGENPAYISSDDESDVWNC